VLSAPSETPVITIEVFFILKGEDKFMRCAICGRKLTNEVSIQRGIGPICYSHILEECGKIPVANFNGSYRDSIKSEFRYQDQLKA
jgi:hypothetical protein